MATIELRRTVDVRHDVDVFVAGGGPSGVAAAFAAARQGSKVFLAEGQNCLGGMGTSGLIPAFMTFGDGVSFLAGGVGREVLDRLIAGGGTSHHYKPKDAYGALPIRTEVLKRVYDDLLLEAGVDFAFLTSLIGVETADGRVEHAILAAKSGIFAVRAKVYVDCTGDADLAAWAGAPCQLGDDDGRMMAGTLCSLWANVDFEAFNKSGIGWQQNRLPDAIRDGTIFTVDDYHLPGMWDLGGGIGGGNIGHTFGVNGTDERSLTTALLHARKSLLEYERYYKQYLRGFERMVLVATAALLGVRETRRVCCGYTLSLDDFRNRAVFDDEIGRYAYGVDIHASVGGRASYEAFERDHRGLQYGPGENYGIPYRALVPQRLSNVLVAGRCIGSDRYIQSSIRVMPGCYITGQAAGVAASLAAQKGAGTAGVNVRELQARLLKLGAHLPNATVMT